MMQSRRSVRGSLADGTKQRIQMREAGCMSVLSEVQ